MYYPKIILEKDIIIGAIANYKPADVACWINSIQACKFDGDVSVINYGCPQETIDFLTSKGVRIFNSSLNDNHIVVQRFADIYQILSKFDLSEWRCAFLTDVKDVIFQLNPSKRFGVGYTNAGFLASTENIRYRDEDWGDNNLKVSYPHLYPTFRDNIIYNAGTISGELELIKDLCLHIYHLSLIGGDPQPDQAAYNILINTRPFIYNAYYTEDEDHWVANLGTTLDPKVKDKYAQHWIDPPPKIKNGLVYNNQDRLYHIVHQYDRVPGLKEEIQKRFGLEEKPLYITAPK